ncbi:hypothetical protein GGR54DRAFT_228504 [Hypoxylon sp. NC1633]|nr:hypothetical protein GGR54DRAFT_228504 [Hypoxylon sp. NC1633]
MFITTTTYGVSISSTATSTTSTGVVTATSVIRGCGTESSSTATTLPTSSSSSVSSLSSESISSSISSIESTSSSISSIESTQIPTSIQDTIESPATNTDSGPLPTQTWHLTMYDTACGEDTNNYYSLRGYALPNDPKTCTSLKDGKVPMASDRKDSCEFFVNGGNSPGKACSEGTFSEPTSFVIRDGYCIVWEDENCQGIGIKFYTPLYHGCVNVKDAINPPKNWQAVKCYAQ